MNETINKNALFRGLRQSLVVTLLLLLLCGLVFPVLLSGISAVIFPSQANGSLVYVDGQAVGAENVGQDFTEPYFMKGRPSAYNYNTYYEDEQGNQYYNDEKYWFSNSFHVQSSNVLLCPVSLQGYSTRPSETGIHEVDYR